MNRAYRAVGFLAGVAGVLVVFFGPVSSVKYGPVEGVAVFAVLYVIAQAVERVVEWLVELLKLSASSPGAKKEKALRALGGVNSTLNGNPELADFGAVTTEKEALEKEVDEARTDISFVGHGVSILLAGVAVNALNYGMLFSLGATGVNGDVDRLFTALAAAGGSKALHELVGRMQKSKEAAESETKTS